MGLIIIQLEYIARNFLLLIVMVARIVTKKRQSLAPTSFLYLLLSVFSWYKEFHDTIQFSDPFYSARSCHTYRKNLALPKKNIMCKQLLEVILHKKYFVNLFTFTMPWKWQVCLTMRFLNFVWFDYADGISFLCVCLHELLALF